MNPGSITHIAHERILSLLSKESIVIDATCGNGHDTSFLADHCRFVYSFDIQEVALITAKKRCKNFENIRFIHDSHENFDTYTTNFNGIVFNLGYLPGGNKAITTTTTTTINTLEKLKNMKHPFFVLIVVYTGHGAGEKESQDILKFLKENKISHEKHEVSHLTKKRAPYILFWRSSVA